MRYSLSGEQVGAGHYQKLSASLRDKTVTVRGIEWRGNQALHNMFFLAKSRGARKEYYDALDSLLFNETDNLDGLLELANQGFVYRDGMRGGAPMVSVETSSVNEGRRLINNNREVLKEYFGVEVIMPEKTLKKARKVDDTNPFKSAKKILKINRCYRLRERSIP